MTGPNPFANWLELGKLLAAAKIAAPAAPTRPRKAPNMKIFQYGSFGIDGLHPAEVNAPEPEARQVIVRIHAASLNYRDLLFAWGVYNPKAKFPTIPLSDGAGEVTAVGSEVTRWKVGDRVCPIFTQG